MTDFFPAQTPVPIVQDPKYALTGAAIIAQAIRDLGVEGLVTAEQIGAILYPRTQAEISASVTPTNYQYEPGDIRRYGAVIDNATNDLTAFHNCLLANGHVKPWVGTALVTGTLTYQAAGNAIRGHGGGVSVLRYSGSGVGIDFDGLDHCLLEGVRILSASSTKAVYVGNIAHWATVKGCDIRGSSTGSDLSGTHNSGVGIEIEQSFYVDITNNDISSFTTGIYGFNQFNGNFVHANSIRRCNTGIKVSSTTANSDGNDISGNEIEGGESGDLYAIEIEGGSNNTVTNNRLEYSPNGTAHIYVHELSGSTDAVRNEICHNHCVGTIPSVIIGDASGSGEVQNTLLLGGYYASTITIDASASYTKVVVDGRSIAGTATAITNNSATSRLSIYNDQSFTVGITGGTTSPTASWTYTIAENAVTIEVSQIVVTSNTTACTITGLPALIRPASTQTVLLRVRDNSATAMGLGEIDSSGVITLTNSVAGGGAMTNGNQKGLQAQTITYRLP